MAYKVVRVKRLMWEIGSNEQGYSLLDVLCAIAIIGVVSLIVWQSLSVGYATVENARQHTLAVIAASSQLTVLELGLESSATGSLPMPNPAKNFTWSSIEARVQGLEVSWTSGQKRNVYQLWNSVDVW